MSEAISFDQRRWTDGWPTEILVATDKATPYSRKCCEQGEREREREREGSF